MHNTFNHIDELIGKYLAGEASLQEQHELESWLDQKQDNRHYFDQVKLIFDKASSIKEYQRFDTDAAWNNVKTKLQGKGKTIALNQSITFKTVWRVAASIVLIATLGVVIYQWMNKPVQMLTFQSGEKVLPDTLPDGSAAVLNKRSSIQYHYDPSKKVRHVKLQGEAYFDVRHEEEKRFIIETEDLIIEDIGTAFNVKAYPQSTTVEVFVETGEVALYTRQNPGLKLMQGETGIYNRQSNSFTKIIQSDTNILAYKTRLFNFYNADLGSVVENLNEVYEVKLRLGNSNLESCRLNVTFKNEPIETIADIIAETFKLTITKKDNEIILDGPGCEQ